MPFYLVTQISLVEANDEQDAAHKAIDQIRAGRQVSVTVKSDEATTSHIVVAAKDMDDQNSTAVRTAKDIEPQPLALPEQIPSERIDRKFLLKRLIGDAFSLMTWRN